uniref:Cell growth-regulating nucleolar protein n=1 Tax=Ciona savignyi TaxID=51511 RepID=H2Z0F6_CIOSA
MVFFTCNGCGESLKKNKVDRHANSCRGCEYLTCIDCSKDFWGDEYAKHTTCITEDQKYAATGFVAKPNKGEVKQQEWIKKVTNAVADSNTSGEVQTILEQLVNYGNIPRKKAKFLNFLKNSLKIRDAKVSEQVWNVFSAANNKGSDTNKPVGADLKEAKPDSQNKEMSPNKDNDSKKTKKRKCSETLEKNNKNSK